MGGHDEIEDAVEEAYDYSAITIPIMHITGWNDYICRNTLEAYHRTKTNSGRTESRLILGPWTHNQLFDSDSTKYGDADFGPTSPLGIDSILSLSITWFDQNVKGLDTELKSKAPVIYFMQGENRWHTSATWPPARVSQKMLYLTSDNGDALLQHAAPKGEATMSFEYNLHNPVPTIGGAVSFRHPFNVGVKDQSSLEGREDILFFESSVLDAPLELVGSISVELYASTDSIDTDFTAKLVEVRSDGYARLIEDGIIRTRYGTNPDSTIIVAANTVQRYHIDLGETAYRVEAGSKLRLEISSGNFPKFDRNPNDGTDPMTTTDFRIAHQMIHLSEKHPSRLMLSVIDR